MKLDQIKLFIAFLTLLPTLAYADLGDSRRNPHNDYPRDWNVTEVYNSEGIVIKVTLCIEHCDIELQRCF
jgi:hypothetical protein